MPRADIIPDPYKPKVTPQAARFIPPANAYDYRQDPTVPEYVPEREPTIPPDSETGQILREMFPRQPQPTPSPILETQSAVTDRSPNAIMQDENSAHVIDAPSTVLPAPSAQPSPEPSRPNIPSAEEVKVNVPPIFHFTPKAFADNLNPLYNPLVHTNLSPADLQKAKDNPVGYVADKGLTSLGVLAIGVNPPAAVLWGILGAGITEGISVATTGQSLPPEELFKAGVQGAGTGLFASGVFKGVSLIPKVGTRIVSSPLGRAGVMSGFSGGLSYAQSGGDITETAKGAAIGGLMSLGSDAIGAGYRFAKSKVSAKSSVKPWEAPEGINKTPLKFDEIPEADPFEGLPSSLAKELKQSRANAKDPLYKALFPKDAAVEAEQRWGSIRAVPEPEVPKAQSLSDDLYKLLFPDRVEQQTLRNAEARWGSINEVAAPAKIKTPTGASPEARLKWEIKAAKFLASKEAYPDWRLDSVILVKQPSAKPLKDLMNWDNIYSKDTIMYKPSVAEQLALKRSKWIDRAWNWKLDVKDVLKEKVPELPKSIGDYIVGKPLGKYSKSASSTEMPSSSGQVLIQLEKAVTEPVVKTAVPKQVAMPSIFPVILPKQKTTTITQQKPKAATDVMAIVLPQQTQKAQQRQSLGQSSVFDNLTKIQVKQKQPQILWQPAPQKPWQSQPVQPKQETKQEPKQTQPLVLKQITLQQQVQKQLGINKSYFYKKKRAKRSELWGRQRIRVAKLGSLSIFDGLPKSSKKGGVTSIIFQNKQNRTRKRRKA